MILTPLESAALIAICRTCAKGEPVLTSKIQFEQGYSKFAGAMSSLRRKGLVLCEGERPHRGAVAASSKRTVVPTPEGLNEFGRLVFIDRWTVEQERYLCFDGQPLIVTKSLGEGFDGTERPLAALTKKIAELLNKDRVVFPPAAEPDTSRYSFGPDSLR